MPMLWANEHLSVQLFLWRIEQDVGRLVARGGMKVRQSAHTLKADHSSPPFGWSGDLCYLCYLCYQTGV